MIELGVLCLSLAVLLDLRHAWGSEGIANHAAHVLVLFLVGSVLMSWGWWEHRQHWMGITLLIVALPGCVALWVLIKKFEEWVKAYRRSR